MGKTATTTRDGDDSTTSCSRIVDSGGYDDLVSRGHDISAVFEEYIKDDDVDKEKSEEIAVGHSATATEINGDVVNGSSKTSVGTKKEKTQVSTPNAPEATMDESMSKGAVPLKAYVTYLKSVRSPLLILSALSCYLFANLATFGQQLTVAKWTDSHATALGGRYLQQLVFAAGFVSVLLWMRSFLLMKVGVRASEFYHDKMLDSIFRAPMSFFDRTPSGQLLSRFGKELEIVDRGVPDAIG